MRGKRVAIPGKLTTAYLVMQLYEADFEPIFVPFDQILETVTRGEADAGVVIHEGQLTYPESGLNKIVDLGEWWHQETNLPLPLGGNLIRRSLDPAIVRAAATLLKEEHPVCSRQSRRGSELRLAVRARSRHYYR